MRISTSCRDTAASIRSVCTSIVRRKVDGREFLLSGAEAKLENSFFSMATNAFLQGH